MALLVLALSCLPCADEGSPMNSKDLKSEMVNATPYDDDHEDACSPFCQCSCCAGFSIDHLVAENSSDINSYNRTYTAFTHSVVIEISLPIWQPPQLL